MKKTYEVELKRESYITIWVEALNEAHAEELAWEEIETGDYSHEDASWLIESIEEVTKQGE